MSGITPLPTPPSTSDPSNFSTRADDFLSALPTFATEANALAAGLNNISTTSTSTTSNTIGTGSKAFTVETGKSYFAGQSVTIAHTAAPTNRMFAVVDSYNSGTGALVVTSQAFEGSGTFTDWTITLGFNGAIGTGQIANDAVTKSKLNADVRASAAEFNVGTAVDTFLNPKVARENAWVYGPLIPTTSGDPLDILTGLPSWVTEVELIFDSVSLSGTNSLLIQPGTAGGYVNSGYIAVSVAHVAAANQIESESSGFNIRLNTASHTVTGVMRLVKQSNNVWASTHVIRRGGDVADITGAGGVDLGAVLTRIRANTNGSDTFDNGTIQGRYR